MDDYQWIDGPIAIEATLQGHSRHVAELLVDQSRREGRLARLEKQAASAGAVVQRVAAAELPLPDASGGVVARVGPRRFVPLQALLPSSGAAAIAMLDGVEDPYNFGQAVRALYAAGVNGLVVRPRNWLTAAATVMRASAGASELMPMAMADTTQEAATFFRGRGLTIAVATTEDSVSIYDADLAQPLFLVIGGEKRGVTRSFLSAVDLRLHIPYGATFTHALGTATASAVIAFEMMRQRGCHVIDRG